MPKTVRGALACLRLALLGLLLPFVVAGCANIAHKQTIGDTRESQSRLPRHIAVFLDGTRNEEASDTNVKRLHSLVSLQRRPDLFTLYVEGVGTGSDLAGAMTGYGIGERVRMAYAFLLQHHRPGDKVYLFGFSRGAYSARMLNSMLYHAGLPPKPEHLTHAEFADLVYGLVKSEVDYPPAYEPLRRQGVQDALRDVYARERAARRAQVSLPARWVPVEVLGLWDTVEALGIADWGSRLRHKAQIEQHIANIDNGNARYGDKLCNVQHAFHAMSIDDNREWIFTPLLMTRRYLFDGCAVGDRTPLFENGRITDRLQEVWFSGAHSDVGGGYADSRLSGVSLNWMIRRMRDFKIPIAPQVEVPEDRFGTSHDPERSLSPLYHEINRDLVAYVRAPTSLVDQLTVHPAVFERRRAVGIRDHENAQLRLRDAGTACLVPAAPVLNTIDARGRLKEAEDSRTCSESGTATLKIVRAKE